MNGIVKLTLERSWPVHTIGCWSIKIRDPLYGVVARGQSWWDEGEVEMIGFKELARRAAYRLGYQVYKIEGPRTPLVFDMDQDFNEIHTRTRPYTITTMAKMYALYEAIQYVVKNDIPGDIVECGVLKGGSSMIAALTLAKLGDTTRTLWLYDTFAGMTEPDERDIQIFDGMQAHPVWKERQRGDVNNWAYAALDAVKANMDSTGYPQENIKYIVGKVEDTLPDQAPDDVAILRLDTDWYQSTYHELNHLFPLISQRGLLILDDYGYWKGCREATDKYIEENNLPIYLSRIDPGCRIAMKIQP